MRRHRRRRTRRRGRRVRLRRVAGRGPRGMAAPIVSTVVRRRRAAVRPARSRRRLLAGSRRTGRLPRVVLGRLGRLVGRAVRATVLLAVPRSGLLVPGAVRRVVLVVPRPRNRRLHARRRGRRCRGRLGVMRRVLGRPRELRLERLEAALELEVLDHLAVPDDEQGRNPVGHRTGIEVRDVLAAVPLAEEHGVVRLGAGHQAHRARRHVSLDRLDALTPHRSRCGQSGVDSLLELLLRHRQAEPVDAEVRSVSSDQCGIRADPLVEVEERLLDVRRHDCRPEVVAPGGGVVGVELRRRVDVGAGLVLRVRLGVGQANPSTEHGDDDDERTSGGGKCHPPLAVRLVGLDNAHGCSSFAPVLGAR